MPCEVRGKEHLWYVVDGDVYLLRFYVLSVQFTGVMVDIKLWIL